MRFAGCPVRLVSVVKGMYEGAWLAVKSDDEVASKDQSFMQCIGVRQGSSLSPCIFVLILDFCMRVMESVMAIELQQDVNGYEFDIDWWLAFADDIAVKLKNPMMVSIILTELQAVCSIVGISLNPAKTVVMAHGITKPQTTISEAVKERVSVQYEEGWFEEGWQIPSGLQNLSMLPPGKVMLLI
jgi:hypothetical protein